MRRKIIFLILSIVTFSCSENDKGLSNYLNYKINSVKATVEIWGYQHSDKLLEEEMLTVLQSISKNGILTDDDIEGLSIDKFRKRKLRALTDTISASYIDEYKLYTVDIYHEAILSNKKCFDRLKTLAIRTADNKIKLYMTADESVILPNVYYSLGDSAYKVKNSERTDNPVVLDLDSLEFDELYEPIKSEESVFALYMIPTRKGDSIFTIKKNEIIDAY